jgi:hypothetical protein
MLALVLLVSPDRAEAPQMERATDVSQSCVLDLPAR